MYIALLGLVSGGTANDCATPEGRMANIGFGIFIMGFITSFTGLQACALERALPMRCRPAVRALPPCVPYHPACPTTLRALPPCPDVFAHSYCGGD